MSALLTFATSWTLLTLALGMPDVTDDAAFNDGLRGALVAGLLAVMFGGTLLAAFEDMEDPGTRGPHMAIIGFFSVIAIAAAGLVLPDQLQAASANLPDPMSAMFERSDLLFGVLIIGIAISTIGVVLGARMRFPWRRR